MGMPALSAKRPVKAAPARFDFLSQTGQKRKASEDFLGEKRPRIVYKDSDDVLAAVQAQRDDQERHHNALVEILSAMNGKSGSSEFRLSEAHSIGSE